MANLRAELLFESTADLDVPLDVGVTPRGKRRIVHATGGSFEGPELRGEILPGSGDWLLRRSDGAWEIDVRATLRTDDDALIFTSYRGILWWPPGVKERRDRGETVDPSEYYFRTTPSFETAAERYEWLNRVVAVGVGTRTATGVAYTVYRIL